MTRALRIGMIARVAAGTSGRYGELSRPLTPLAGLVTTPRRRAVRFWRLDDSGPAPLRQRVAPASMSADGGRARPRRRRVSRLRRLRRHPRPHDGRPSTGDRDTDADRDDQSQPVRPPLQYRFAALAPEVAVIAISHHHAATAVGIPIAATIHHGSTPPTTRLGRIRGYALFLDA